MDKYISNELSKKDTNMTKGLAIIFMVLLHLFCRIDNLPYECLKIGGYHLLTILDSLLIVVSLFTVFAVDTHLKLSIINTIITKNIIKIE